MGDGDGEPTTEQMRIVQGARAEKERSAAARAPDEEEAAQHERRADKADYLRERLAEREESERGLTATDEG